MSISNNCSKTVPIGVVLPLMGGNSPTGYLICDGTTYQISAYPELTDQNMQ